MAGSNARATVRWDKADQLRRLKLAEKVYSHSQIELLYKYALPSERLIMLLALNCGFRQAEIKSLHSEEIKGNRIVRFRGKSDIFAEWQLWPETVEALATTEKPKKITDTWNTLLARVCKDRPTFKRLSFKRLCKTGATAIRRIAGGEVASMYVSHGNHTDDELLEVYAAADWKKLAEALLLWRGELNLQSLPVGRTALPISKIELCRTLWRELPMRGMRRIEEIMRQTGMSKASVYRYVATVPPSNL